MAYAGYVIQLPTQEEFDAFVAHLKTTVQGGVLVLTSEERSVCLSVYDNWHKAVSFLKGKSFNDLTRGKRFSPRADGSDGHVATEDIEICRTPFTSKLLPSDKGNLVIT